MLLFLQQDLRTLILDMTAKLSDMQNTLQELRNEIKKKSRKVGNVAFLEHVANNIV